MDEGQAQQKQKLFKDKFQQLQEIQQTNIEHSTQSQLFYQYQLFFNGLKAFDRNVIRSSINDQSVKMYEDTGENQSQSGFRILAVKPTNSSQIYQISVSLYPFYAKLLVLLNSEDSFKEEKHYKEGSQGKIYLNFNQFKKTSFIVKSIAIKSQEEWSITFFRVLKEYTFALIMSALSIGPKLTKDLGFDIVIFQKSMEFAMQFCSAAIIDERATKQLKQNLSIMHHLNIVHLDIKPQNIAFSHFFNRCIFLDFGISRVVSQSIGFKTKTAYCGTLQYSSLQLRQCFQKPGFVDLYYNDVYGLMKTIENHTQITVKKKREFAIENQQRDHQNISCLKLTTAHKNSIIKYHLHKEEWEFPKRLCDSYDANELQNSVESLFQYFFPSYFLKDFYYKKIYKKLSNSKANEKLDAIFKKTTNPTKIVIQKIQIKLKIEKLKDILFYFNQNSNQISTTPQNGLLAYLDIKTVLLSEKIIKTLQKEAYIKIFFKYVTFQSNKYRATLKDKQQVAAQFLKHFKIQQTSYLGYDLSVSELLGLIVSIKFLIDYCSIKPYNQTAIWLYPKAWAQFILINPDICQRKLSKYYNNQILKIVQDQLSETTNFYKKFHNYFRIRLVTRLISCRDEQFNFINTEKRKCNINLETQEQSSESNYDLKKDLVSTSSQHETAIILQFIQFFYTNVDFFKKSKTIKKNQLPKFQLLETEIILNQNISKAQKQFFLYKLATQRLFRVFWRTGNTKLLRESIKQVYLCTNFDELNEYLIQLCMYYSQLRDVNNCRQIIRIIDSTINCELVSNKLLTACRLFVQYYSNNRKKAVEYFSLQIQGIKQYQSINQFFYLNLIKWSSVFVNQRFSIKFKNQPDFQKTNQKIIELNQILIIKIKKCIQKLLTKLDQTLDYQNKKFQYYELYNFLSLSIKYLLTDNPSNKQQLFILFQKHYSKIQSNLSSTNLWKYMQVKTNLIVIKVIEYTQKNKLLQLLIFLEKQIHDDIQKDQYILETDNSLASLYPFIKFIQFFNFNKTNKESLDIIYSNSSEENILLFRQQAYQIRIHNIYSRTIQKMYAYFIQSKMFQQTCRNQAPNHQFYLYFYSLSKFQQIFNYMYQFTKWISKSPTIRLIDKLIKDLCNFRTQNMQFSQQFSKHFFQLKFHDQHQWQNPTWWLLTSIMCSFLQKTQTKLLVKMSRSIKYLFFQAKKQILKTLYSHVLKKWQNYHDLSVCFGKLKKKDLKQIPRKIRYWLKHHLQHFAENKFTSSNLEYLEINHIKCKDYRLRQSVSQKFKIKLIKFHKNVQNFCFQ